MKEPLQLHCWEGYESEQIIGPFREAWCLDVTCESLLSDASAAMYCKTAGKQGPDVLNINNAYIANYLAPHGLIKTLNSELIEESETWLHKDFSRLQKWTCSSDGKSRLGIAQRFGSFNFVVNSKEISKASAEDQGFNIVSDQTFKSRYGILLYEDFNLFHICIAANINPFKELADMEIMKFTDHAKQWFFNAKVISDDHMVLNKYLQQREISFYLSGGGFTAAVARLAGHHELVSITPLRGPIDGRGGIVFTEITSVIDKPSLHPHAVHFIEHLIKPEMCFQAAKTHRSCNPVLQMGNPAVFQQFDKSMLKAIQWDTLAEDILRCADYDLMPSYHILSKILRKVLAQYEHKKVG